MGGGIEQALMLVLAAKVNQRAHALGKLTHAGQAAVDARARATVGTQAARHHEALLVMWARKQTALHQRAFAPLSNRGGVGTLPHEQLECGEQRGFSRSGLAREHGEARARYEVRLADQGHIFDMDLIDHDALRRTHGSPSGKALRTIIEQQNIGAPDEPPHGRPRPRR